MRKNVEKFCKKVHDDDQVDSCMIGNCFLLEQHLKDIITLRRTDGETLRRLNKADSSVNGLAGGRAGGNEMSWDDLDLSLVVSRERCLPVVRGLVTLLLSMDFTCHVDLFIIACKVCRITSLALFEFTIITA